MQHSAQQLVNAPQSILPLKFSRNTHSILSDICAPIRPICTHVSMALFVAHCSSQSRNHAVIAVASPLLSVFFPGSTEESLPPWCVLMQRDFSEKDQTVNILGFMGHLVSAITTQLCPCSLKAARDKM